MLTSCDQTGHHPDDESSNFQSVDNIKNMAALG
jgi:hypothetical protein